MITVIPFEEKFSLDFKHLNLEWLREYFAAEPYDEYQLSHPRREIIEKGGYVFLVKEYQDIIGTVALMKENARSFELTKMSVTKDSQGKGISKLLMDTCIKKRKKKNGNAFFFIPILCLFRLFNYTGVMDLMKFRWK